MSDPHIEETARRVRADLRNRFRVAENKLPYVGDAIEWLEQKGGSLWSGDSDLPLFCVYENQVANTGEVLVSGEIVIPGGKTLAQFPNTKKYGIHFRKTFHPNAPPLRRGETPGREAELTAKANKCLGNDGVEVLGWSDNEFRSRVIRGRTLASMSPFTGISYEKALTKNKKHLLEVGNHLKEALIQVSDSIERFHAGNLCHNDLHTENVLIELDHEGNVSKARLIDLAGSSSKEPDLQADDWCEIDREFCLLQATITGPINHPRAIQALRQCRELFPDDIALQIEKATAARPLPKVPSPTFQVGKSRQIERR